MSDLATEPKEPGALAPAEQRAPGPAAAGPRSGLSLGRIMRLLLPLAALALVGAVFYLAARGTSAIAPPGLTIGEVTIGDGLEVTNPRFLGETSDGKPFQLTADRAQPDGPDPERIKLFGVEGDVMMPGDRSLSASADSGLFKPKEQTLRLEGGVIARTSDGYTLSSQAMRFDLEQRIGETEQPVRIEGPMGQLTAQKMTAQFQADLVATFSGGVKINIVRLVEREEP